MSMREAFWGSDCIQTNELKRNLPGFGYGLTLFLAEILMKLLKAVGKPM